MQQCDSLAEVTTSREPSAIPVTPVAAEAPGEYRVLAVGEATALKEGYNATRFALAACVGAALAGALEFALPALAGTEGEAGATASAIDTAAFFLTGAGIGSACGALLASILHRSQPNDVRFESGVFAGLVGAATALLPPLVYSAHGDILVIIGALIIASPIVTVFVFAGALGGIVLTRFFANPLRPWRRHLAKGRGD